MSAYLVDDCHITAMLNSLAPRHQGDARSYYHNGRQRPTGGRHRHMAQILVDQNVRSVNHHYKATDPSHPYRCEPRVPTMSPVEVISLCNGYDYQACETSDYHDTEAFAIVRCIREHAISNLPGMDKAPWTIYQHDLETGA